MKLHTYQVAGALILGLSTARSELVEASFTVRVDSLLGGITSLHAGDTGSGYFFYDSDLVDQDPSNNGGLYGPIMDFNMKIAGYSVRMNQNSPNRIVVNDNGYATYDSLIFQIDNLNIGIPDYPRDSRNFSMPFRQAAGTLFTNDHLPTNLTEKQFDTGSMILGTFVPSTVTSLTIGPAKQLYTLCIGTDDRYPISLSSGVRGDLDAKDVYGILSSKMNFAAPAKGNTSSPLLLNRNNGPTATLASVNASLDAIAATIKKDDTFVFYFSGHGGTFRSGTDETPVLTQNKPDPDFVSSGDEFIVLGAGIFSLDLTDDELVRMILSRPALNAARKIFILDSCRSGGFWGEGLTNDYGDLNKLSNVALIAASSEGGLTGTLSDGRGVFTHSSLLPILRRDVSFDDLKNLLAATQAQLNTDFAGQSLLLKDAEFPDGTMGTVTFSSMVSQSGDFNATQLAFGAVPESSSFALFGLGAFIVGQIRRRGDSSASHHTTVREFFSRSQS